MQKKIVLYTSNRRKQWNNYQGTPSLGKPKNLSPSKHLSTIHQINMKETDRNHYRYSKYSSAKLPKQAQYFIFNTKSKCSRGGTLFDKDKRILSKNILPMRSINMYRSSNFQQKL